MIKFGLGVLVGSVVTAYVAGVVVGMQADDDIMDRLKKWSDS